MPPIPYGYQNRILRINLNTGSVTTEPLKQEDLRPCVGGTGLGAKYLYDEVPPGVEWDSPQNRLIFMTGPLTGTRIPG
ncbi:MAG: aldehyde:ferredoxin oxidoreductase, partial [Clostridia bacterium]|nr:aldehyde:ferredoxin oxidoreductase [Clostridia bacterium]